MKIAIVGTGQGYEKAPYGTDWKVWGMTGLYKVGDRFDRVYEIHGYDEFMADDFPKEKFEFIKKNVNVINGELAHMFPNARVIDFKALIDKYGEYFCSTISWMFAEAIEAGATEIALHGVSMSSDSEYAHQKPSLCYLIGYARALGIKVTSDRMGEIMSAPFIYGMQKKPEALTMLSGKKARAKNTMAQAEAEVFAAKEKYHKAQGWLEAFEYMENNWHAGSRV